ncbi:MAG: GAF domain-containing protein [Xanthomonadaceae bacterium]|nr:GAF domain-containing protein [Xanthomonadaceae bacterium]
MSDDPILPILEESEDISPQSSDYATGGDDVAHWISRAALSEKFLKSIVKPTSFKTFVSELLLEIVKTVKCEAASIIEISRDGKSMFFRAATGQSSDQLDPIEIPVSKGIAGHVVTTRQPYIMKRNDNDDKQLKTVDNTVGFQTNNLIAIPIFIRGHVYGVLELLNRVGDDEFSVKDVELLTFAAETAAKAIEVRIMFNWLATQNGVSAGTKAA